MQQSTNEYLLCYHFDVRQQLATHLFWELLYIALSKKFCLKAFQRFVWKELKGSSATKISQELRARISFQ